MLRAASGDRRWSEDAEWPLHRVALLGKIALRRLRRTRVAMTCWLPRSMPYQRAALKLFGPPAPIDRSLRITGTGEADEPASALAFDLSAF